jgi:hypothetical protein
MKEMKVTESLQYGEQTTEPNSYVHIFLNKQTWKAMKFTEQIWKEITINLFFFDGSYTSPALSQQSEKLHMGIWFGSSTVVVLLYR